MDSHLKKSYLSVTEIFSILIIGILGTIFWGIHLGMDFNPDLINYHLYSGYLATHKKNLVNDIFPAGIQGYLNPYIYIVFYTLYKFLSPKLVSIILSALHGICFISIYVIARILFCDWDKRISQFAAFSCACFGIINPFFLAMVGSSFTDNLTPSFILIPLAIILIIHYPNPLLQKKYSSLWYLVAGALVGFAVGFKLTNCAFAIAFVPAWLVNFRNKKQVYDGFLFFIAIGVGFLCINGEWMWSLYHDFNNPTFPFYNNIFRSNMLEFVPTNVPAQAAATSLYEVLAYPFRWAYGIPPISEWKFYDTRYAIISVLLAAILLSGFIPKSIFHSLNIKIRNKFGISREKPAPQYLIHRYWFLAIWCTTAYLFWIDQFGAMRYLMPITLLTGIIILLCLNRLIPYRNLALITWVILALVAMSLIQSPQFGRVKFRHSWYPITVPPKLLEAKNTLYMQEDQLPSLVIPFLPKESNYIGLLYFKYIKENEGFRLRAQKIINQHQGPIRTLSMPSQFYLDPFFDEQLKLFGLRRDPRDCVNLTGGDVYLVQSCRIEHITENTKPLLLPSSITINFNYPRSPWISYVDNFKGQLGDGMLIKNKFNIKLLGLLPQHFKVRITALSQDKKLTKALYSITIDKQKRNFTINQKKAIHEFTFHLKRKDINTITFNTNDYPDFVLNSIVFEPI